MPDAYHGERDFERHRHARHDCLEAEVRGLFEVEAAAFFPSGVMAQQTALRIHTDRAASRRVAIPDLSHLLVHEDKVYATADADSVNERVLALVEEHRIGFPAWRPTRDPGRISTEFAVTGAALGLDPAEMAALIGSAVDPGHAAIATPNTHSST